MQLAYDTQNNILKLRYVGDMYQDLVSLGMKWNKAQQILHGRPTLGVLDYLSRHISLIPELERKRQRMRILADSVTKERARTDVTPLIAPPIKQGVKPYQHQIRAYNMALMEFGLMNDSDRPYEPLSDGFGFLFEMGCGKSLTAIMTAGTLYQRGLTDRLLIVAPTSVCSVWEQELASFADFRYQCKVLLGTKQQRLKTLDTLSKPRILNIAVINYESVWRDDIYGALRDWHADMIICDESQRIKTHNTKQSKALHTLGDETRYKLILSGTPVQNNAIDLYSQYRFLNPDIFGTNFYSFKARYAIMGGFDNKQIIGYKNLDELVKKEYAIAYRVTKADALDLPEQVFERRYVEFDPKTKDLYKKLMHNSYAELENGGSVTAATALTKLLRLQQMTGGFLVTDDGAKPQQISDCKIRALKELVEDYCIGEHKKLVIFARFRAELALIEKCLQSLKLRYGLIHGDIRQEDRGDIVADFQNNPETMCFVAQIDTAGLGITLTAADTCVYYSTNFNYAAYSQSLSRIHRIGQTNKCTYIHLLVKGTVDVRILRALEKKEDIAHTIVDDWKKYFIYEEE